MSEQRLELMGHCADKKKAKFSPILKLAILLLTHTSTSFFSSIHAAAAFNVGQTEQQIVTVLYNHRFYFVYIINRNTNKQAKKKH